MSGKKNKGGSGNKSAKQDEAKGSTPFGKIRDVAEVLKRFLSDNTGVQSSVVTNAVMDKIAELDDVNAIFLVPLKEKILGFDGARDWAFFLNMGEFRKFVADDVKYPNYKFDIGKALEQIEKVYDLAMEDYISYLDDEEEEAESGRSRGHSE